MHTTLAEPNLRLVSELRPISRKGGALSLDVDIATCEVLAALSGNQVLPADAFNQLIELNRKLIHNPQEEILDSLTRQKILLEALWLHFANRACNESRSDHASSLLKVSLNCQRALSNTLGTIHHLSENPKVAKVSES